MPASADVICRKFGAARSLYRPQQRVALEIRAAESGTCPQTRKSSPVICRNLPCSWRGLESGSPADAASTCWAPPCRESNSCGWRLRGLATALAHSSNDAARREMDIGVDGGVEARFRGRRAEEDVICCSRARGEPRKPELKEANRDAGEECRHEETTGAVQRLQTIGGRGDGRKMKTRDGRSGRPTRQRKGDECWCELSRQQARRQYVWSVPASCVESTPASLGAAVHLLLNNLKWESVDLNRRLCAWSSAAVSGACWAACWIFLLFLFRV